MPTAIVRSYTEDGFIIAADGLQTDVDTGKPQVHNRQKIYQIGHSPAAYCITGATLLGHVNEVVLSTVLFDFLGEIHKRVEEQPVDQFDTLRDWGRSVFTRVFESLENACECGKVDLPTKLGQINGAHTILTVYLDGYVRGTPQSVVVRFSHLSRVPLRPEVFSDELGTWFAGSIDVANAMMGNDPAFAKYGGDIPPKATQLSEALNGAIGRGLRYMECCMSPEGLALDPTWCRTIGGHIHIAKITPKVGFRWITGFEPAP